MDPFYILLPECWEKVLEKVDDPLDRLNLISTNSQLEREFQNKIGEWGFAAVLPIVIDRYESGIFLYDEEIPKAFGQCRLVSSECCKAVSKFVEGFWSCGSDSLLYVAPEICLDSREDIDRYLNKIRDVPQARNPIVRRDIELNCKWSEDAQISMIGQSIQLMEKIGQHLYSITITINVARFPDVPTLVGYLESLLQQLPNLRCLTYKMEGQEEIHDVIENFPNPNEAIQQLILPSIPTLQTMTLASRCINAPEKIADYISFKGYFSLLTNLIITSSLWRESYSGEEGLFPNLQFLDVISVDLVKDSYDAELLIGLLRKLDAPGIKCITIQSVYIRYPWESMDACAVFVKDKGNEFLSERYPNKAWKSQLDPDYVIFEQFIGRVKNFGVQWYDSNKMQLPPPKIIEPPIPIEYCTCSGCGFEE